MLTRSNQRSSWEVSGRRFAGRVVGLGRKGREAWDGWEVWEVWEVWESEEWSRDHHRLFSE